jgi:ketosteroid isomerase-like protein
LSAVIVGIVGVMEHADAVRVLARLHDAQGVLYAGGDEAPVRAVLTEDVHWHVPGRNAIAGDYEGIDAVLAYFRRRRDLAGRTFRMHPGDVLTGAGDRVAVLTDGKATIDGTERRWSTVGLYELRGDRVAACWLLPLDPGAFDEIWSGGVTGGG